MFSRHRVSASSDFITFPYYCTIDVPHSWSKYCLQLTLLIRHAESSTERRSGESCSSKPPPPVVHGLNYYTILLPIMCTQCAFALICAPVYPFQSNLLPGIKSVLTIIIITIAGDRKYRADRGKHAGLKRPVDVQLYSVCVGIPTILYYVCDECSGVCAFCTHTDV